MNNTVGSKIKHLRTKLEICQQDLCSDILSRTVLSKIENGKVIPSIFQLKQIAQKLNVSIDYLLEASSEQNEMTNEKKVDTSFLSKLYEEQQYYQIISYYEKGSLVDIKAIDINFYVGYSYYSTNYYKNAIIFLRKFLSNYLKLELNERDFYILNFATALNTLSKIMAKNSNYDKAIHYYSLAKKHLEIQNKTHLKIYYIIISNMGSIYCMSNNYKKCIEVLESFLITHKDLCYLKLQPNIHLSLNIAYYNIDEYEKSIENIKKAIFLYNYSDRTYDARHCYLNYINALRYCNKFHEAFSILKEYKDKYSEFEDLQPNFSIQEIILYFNVNNYELVKDLVAKVKQRNLSSLSKNSYFFIKGHLLYLEKNMTQAMYLLKKCEKYFLNHNFTYDLTLIYTDLYEITNDPLYKDKAQYFMKQKGKKNILVEPYTIR